jgi:MFS family permease
MSIQQRVSLWRHRQFMKLWTAETISQVGTQVTMIALPATAIGPLHATAFQVGLLTACETAPFLLIGLPAGVWIDRMSRWRTLIVGDLGRAVVLGSVPAAAAFHVLRLPQLYAVAFVTGIFTVFFDIAYQSYLPSLVYRDQLIAGNAKLEISRSGAYVAGPAIGGWLVQLIEAPFAILVDAVSYLGSALFISRIRAEEPPIERHEDGSGSMKKQIGEGLRYVLGHPLLRPIAACTSISNLFTTMAFTLTILFGRHLGMSYARLGTVFSLGTVGALLGAVLAERVARKIGLGWAIILPMIIFSVVDFGWPLATPSTASIVFVTVMFFAGGTGVIYNVNQVGLRQAITPGRMLGRMNATMRFIVWGTMPIGALLGGWLGGQIGLRNTLWVSATGNMLAILPPLFSPVRKLREIPQLAAEGDTQGSSA